MYLKVLEWPESQEVMDDDDWFFIQPTDNEILGSSAYAKIIDIRKEFIEIISTQIVNEVLKEFNNEISNLSGK